MVSLALAAALSLAPDSVGVSQLVEDIELAVSLGPQVFEGPAAREATALALVSIAWGESGFRPEVRDCQVTGDKGRSVSAFQLMRGASWAGHSREDICTSQPLAASLALGVLKVHGKTARRHASLFLGYASGSASRPSKAGWAHCHRWQRLATEAGLEGAVCDGPRRPIGWASKGGA